MSRARAATPAASDAPPARPAAGAAAAAAKPKAGARRRPRSRSAPRRSRRRAERRRSRSARRTATGRPAAKRRGHASPRHVARPPAHRRPTARVVRPRPCGAARRRGADLARRCWSCRDPVAGAAGYFFWLRDSSLVAVTDVEVVGRDQRRPRADRRRAHPARRAADDPARRPASDRARRARPSRPSSRSSVDPNFPHGMRIEVTERPPALLVEAGGRARSPRPPTGPCSPGSRSRGRPSCRCSRSTASSRPAARSRASRWSRR